MTDTPGQTKLPLRGPLWLRYLLVVSGTVALVLGVVGIFVPVLPTTPLILLAAACYARSSPRFYAWVLRHRVFGATVRQWQESRTIPRRAKWTAVLLVCVAFSVTLLLVPNCVYGYVTLGLIAAALLIFLGRLPTVSPANS